MTGVDEIINYQRNPDDDYYALLGCDENSTVSNSNHIFLFVSFVKCYILDLGFLLYWLLVSAQWPYFCKDTRVDPVLNDKWYSPSWYL